MDYAATLETIKRKKQALEKRAADLKKKQSKADGRATTHIKTAVGASVLARMNDEGVPASVRAWILKISDSAVQKQGLGREKFEALKARFTYKPQKGEADAIEK